MAHSVENRVAFHKRNFGFNLRALLVDAGLGEGVGANDKRTFFALANLSALLGGLLIGQPQRAVTASCTVLHDKGRYHA